MKLIQTTAFAVILALAGVSAVKAQEPEQDKDKQKQQEEEKKKQPATKEQPKPEDRKAQTQADKDKERQDADRQKQQTNERADKQKADQKQYASQPSGGAQGGGDRNGSRRIPQEKFQASFGREHHFHVQRRDDRRFEYGGYTFEYNDAWPAAWSWDDDVYVEEDGGVYYLVDLSHPGIRLMLVII